MTATNTSTEITPATPGIWFSNPGEIDPQLITTIGVNVKPTAGAGAIGYFGTGLKYAIAVALREHQRITIWSGLTEYRFWLIPTTIRGKEFQIVGMSTDGGPPVALGFTTEYGKNWGLEEAYRELYSNCKDEGGSTSSMPVEPSPGSTVIAVSGSAFWDTHIRRGEFLLDPARRPIWQVEGLGEIYLGPSHRAFYRGIAVYRQGGKGFQFTYNITKNLRLTEDRTAISMDVECTVAELLLQCQDQDIISSALGRKNTPEAESYWLSWGGQPSEAFYNAIEHRLQEAPCEISSRVLGLYYAARPKKLQRTAAVLGPKEELVLAEAIQFCESIGFAISRWPIEVCEKLGENVMALAEAGRILLAHRIVGTPVLVPALIEESLHLQHEVGDFTREMQNLLFREIVRLGEELAAARAKASTRASENRIMDTATVAQ